MNSNNVGCEKILNLFRSELVTVNVGPKILATALEKQGYKAIQVDWKPAAGGDKEMQEILDLLGGLD
ncbi:MAG: fdrA domain protein [Ruminococcus sp.]|nr:fdrA domain protein [Ruminococcus sp.]